MNLSGVPLLPVLAAMVAGELCALSLPDLIVWFAAACLVLCVAGILSRRYFAAVMAAFGCVGVMAMWIATPYVNPYLGMEGRYSGRVTEVVARPLSQRFVFEAYRCNGSYGKQEYAGKTVVYLGSPLPVVEKGDVVVVDGMMLEAFESPKPGGWSMEHFVRRRGISGRMKVWEDDVAVVAPASGRYAVIDKMRRKFSDAACHLQLLLCLMRCCWGMCRILTKACATVLRKRVCRMCWLLAVPMSE